MTDEEKKQLVVAVITQLKSEGTDVSNANIVSNANGIDYVVAYGKKGQIVRAVPTAISSEKVGATGYMNAYTEAGVYNINTNGGEDLPIDNQGAISARLTVLVTESGGNKVITQVLNLNNNAGGEGNVYIRSCQNGEWKAWGKLQTNIEVGQVNTLDNLTDNGIYSGVFTDGTPTSVGTFYDTFVLIVINNYAVSIPTGNPQSISQLKYSLGLDGLISVASRKRDQYGYWDNWSSLDEKSLVEEIKQNTIAADSLGCSTTTNDISLEFETLDGQSTGSVTIPAATTTTAGVMSAEDKEKLDSLSQEGDITAVPTDVVIEEIEPNLVSTAIRKTPQVLTDSEKKIARRNIGAAEADAIEKSRQLALRALFIAAGAEYNDSGVDKTKTAPWGETVTHKAGHYYLNGLGDITEEQMSEIYTSDKFWISKDARGFLSGYKVRTNITAKAAELFRGYAYDFANSVYECPNLEVLVLCNPASTSDNYRTITISRFSESLYGVRKLKRIFGILNLRSTTTTNLHATVLEHINILGLMCNLNISKTGVISKESVLYMIQKAAPTSEITITLHADAYARLANNADIVAALEAQPLITLVSA